jgi:hypothetical protein
MDLTGFDRGRESTNFDVDAIGQYNNIHTQRSAMSTNYFNNNVNCTAKLRILTAYNIFLKYTPWSRSPLAGAFSI